MNPVIEFDVEVPIEVQQHPCLTCMHYRPAVHVYRQDGETYAEPLACRSAPVADFSCAELATARKPRGPGKGKGGRRKKEPSLDDVVRANLGMDKQPKRRGRPPKVQPEGGA